MGSLSTSTSTPTPFNFNISFSEPVNRPGDEPVLSKEDVWQGILHGARYPHEMAEYVSNCEILDDKELKFRRRLTIGGGGAVHTGAGMTLDQDVILRPGLNVEAISVDSGSTTIFGVSAGALDNDDTNARPDLYFTGTYELYMGGVEDGTSTADEVREKYGALARGATRDGVQTFRRWKKEGKLDKWAQEKSST